MKPNYIDLFAGCGGLSLGLHLSGWKGVFAIEKSPDAFETLKHNLIENINHFNWPKWLPIAPHEINELNTFCKKELQKLTGKIDLVAGGPPCQGFSTAGKRNEQDERNKLLYSYIDFIKVVKPKLLFFENVKGFTYAFKKENSKGIPYSKIVVDELSQLGYKIKAQVINFSEYGIPQRRKRFILVGGLNVNPDYFLIKLKDQKELFLREKELTEPISVENAISDLLRANGIKISPDSKNFKAGVYSNISSKFQELMRNKNGDVGKIVDSHRFAKHTETVKQRFKYLIGNAPHNKELKEILSVKYNLKKRTLVTLDKNGISPTLTTLPDDCIHYCEPRILTVREYARLQTFPDWYEFKGKYTTGAKLRKTDVPRYTQVGNAIPPLFVEQVGLVLKDIL